MFTVDCAPNLRASAGAALWRADDHAPVPISCAAATARMPMDPSPE
jgi:hypothetical protein